MTNCTPRITMQSDERLSLSLNRNDAAKIKRGGKWNEIVTDEITGKRYHLAGMVCGLPGCFCDAFVVCDLGVPSSEHFDYLEALRSSGEINMMGAAPYLEEEFGVSRREARDILKRWMQQH